MTRNRAVRPLRLPTDPDWCIVYDLGFSGLFILFHHDTELARGISEKAMLGLAQSWGLT